MHVSLKYNVSNDAEWRLRSLLGPVHVTTRCDCCDNDRQVIVATYLIVQLSRRPLNGRIQRVMERRRSHTEAISMEESVSSYVLLPFNVHIHSFLALQSNERRHAMPTSRLEMMRRTLARSPPGDW